MLNRLADMRFGVLLWLLAYGALWVLLPLTFNSGLPLDVVEIVAWGREWLVGLYRHPPMKTWLMEIFFQLSNGWLGSAYVLSALAFAVAQIGIYAAIRDVQSKSVAFAAVVISALIVYFGVHLPQWNANIAQLPFAALFVFSIWRALDRGNWYWWLLAGASAAGGFLAKYSFALIPIAVAIYVLYNPWARTRIRPLQAAIAACLLLLLIAPNLNWLWQSMDAAQESVARHSGLKAGGWAERILSPLSVIGVTIAAAILPFIATRFGVVAIGQSLTKDQRIQTLKGLFAAAFLGPVFFVILLGVASGLMIKDHWLIVNFLFLPPWLILQLHGNAQHLAWTKQGSVFWFGAVLAIASLYPLERASHYWFANGEPVAWMPLMPAQPLADTVQRVWDDGLHNAGMSKRPIAIVGGGVAAAAVANVLPARPAWFEHLDPLLSPWISDEILKEQGIVVVGEADASRLEGLGLCVVASRTYDWLNGRGIMGTKIQVTAYLPNQNCL